MIFDKQNLFSEDQAITVTANSTNVIDLGLTEMGEGNPIQIVGQVTTAFAGGTSMVVSLYTDSAVGMGTEVLVQSTAGIITAALIQGYRFTFSVLPEDLKRYLRITYTVTGTMSAGAVFFGLNLDRDTWKALPDAL